MRKLFVDVPIKMVFEKTKLSIYNTLNQFNSFREVDIESTADNLVSQFKIHPTKINPEKVNVTPTLKKRTVKYNVDMRKQVEGAIIVYTIPFSGDVELFYVQPRQVGPRTVGVEIGNNNITFNVNPDYATLDLPEEKQIWIRQEAKKIIEFITNTLDQINKDCAGFNESLKPFIIADIKRRKDEEDKLDKLADNLKI